MKRMLGFLLLRLEHFAVLAMCRVRGIPWAIRYLRNPNPLITPGVLRHFGAQIGQGTTFKGPLFLDNVYQDKDSARDFSHLTLGNNCYIGDGVYFDLANRVILHDNVVVAGRASFLTHADCNRSKILADLFLRRCQPIEVQSDVWIGFGAVIMSGVGIGAQSVIAAGALVNSPVEGGAIYAGVPATRRRGLDAGQAGPLNSA